MWGVYTVLRVVFVVTDLIDIKYITIAQVYSFTRYFDILQTILPIMNEYAEVETCVEVSSCGLCVFYFAQRVDSQLGSHPDLICSYVLYPPIFISVLCKDTTEHQWSILLCTESGAASHCSFIQSRWERGKDVIFKVQALLSESGYLHCWDVITISIWFRFLTFLLLQLRLCLIDHSLFAVNTKV